MCSDAAGREGRTRSRISLHQFLALPQPYLAVLIFSTAALLTNPFGPGSEMALSFSSQHLIGPQNLQLMSLSPSFTRRWAISAIPAPSSPFLPSRT